MKKPADIVEELRVAIDMAEQQLTQIVYEQWLKQEQWSARETALPLIIGCDPQQWQHYLNQHELTATEELCWHILSNDLGVEAGDQVSVGAITEWARVQSVTLHPSFLRIYGFVRKVMISSGMPESATTNPEDMYQLTHEQQLENEQAQGREIVLGAALSLLAKVPEKCRDSNGFVDGAVITALIEQTAVKWFPAGSSALSASEMAGLIDKWLE